jgi:hypothetical protein
VHLSYRAPLHVWERRHATEERCTLFLETPHILELWVHRFSFFIAQPCRMGLRNRLVGLVPIGSEWGTKQLEW